MGARLAERRGEAEDAVIAAVDHVEVTGGVDGEACRRSETRGAGAGRTLRDGRQQVELPENDVGRLAVGERCGGAPSEDAVVAGIGDVDGGGCGGEIEGDSLGIKELAAFDEVGIEVVRGEGVLADNAGRRGVEGDLAKQHLREQRRNCQTAEQQREGGESHV